MQTREAGSAKRRDEFGTIRRCGEETPESGSVRSGMFGARRWLGKRAALNGAWEGGRGKMGEGTTGPGAPSAKRKAQGARRLPLGAYRIALGAWARLFPWIRKRSLTGNGTGSGPIVETLTRRKLVVVMRMNFGRLEGVRKKHRNQALSGAACPTLGGGWGSVPLLTELEKVEEGRGKRGEGTMGIQDYETTEQRDYGTARRTVYLRAAQKN